MSLVFEALQKAEREKQNKTDSPPPPAAAQPAVAPKPAPQPPAPLPAAPPKSPQVIVIGLAACVAVVAIVAIVFIVSRTLTGAHKLDVEAGATPLVSNTPPAAPSPPVETVAAPPPIPLEERYKITGIMPDADGSLLATINGRIVAVSNYVDGAIIKKIERDRVTLDIKGREAVLRLF
jgi:hypothetical protein